MRIAYAYYYKTGPPGNEGAETIQAGIDCLKGFYHSLGLETSLQGLGIRGVRHEQMTRGALGFVSLGKLKKQG